MKRMLSLRCWRWLLVLPFAWAAEASAAGFTNAQYAAHIAALKKKLPSKEFSIVLEKPFVVVGDLPAADLRKRWAAGTVRWPAVKLKAAYFKKDPIHILDIWLFKDEASYEQHSKALWGSKPSTPYGYYSSFNRALVMNIATGGGTLVHEIVHPFVEANFPDCPAWFNEGLGSLYEQSTERNGSSAPASCPPSRRLPGRATAVFYTSARGNNYAQARYLCYYLQERGLLRKYYRAFHANRKTDPTGYGTLVATLSKPDMAVFQKRWEGWVLKLTFP